MNDMIIVNESPRFIFNETIWSWAFYSINLPPDTGDGEFTGQYVCD